MARVESELLKQTMDLIRNRPRTMTYQAICNATKVPLQFLQDLMGNRLKDPGVTRIEILYNFMTKTKLMFTAKEPVFEPQV